MELTNLIEADKLARALALQSRVPLDAAAHSGSLVRAFRDRLEISQRVLSVASGCPCAALSRWERYGLLPYPKALAGVGAALGRLLVGDRKRSGIPRLGPKAKESWLREFRRAFWILVVADQMRDNEDGSGALVSTLREVQGLSQRDLAVQAGIPLPLLEAWESRGLVPNADVVKAVASGLEYDPVQLWHAARKERFVDPDWYVTTP